MGRVSKVGHVQVGRLDGKSKYSGACTGVKGVVASVRAVPVNK